MHWSTPAWSWNQRKFDKHSDVAAILFSSLNYYTFKRKLSFISGPVDQTYYAQSTQMHARNDILWWLHQLKTLSALLTICVGNSPVTGEFPTQRPVTRSFDVFFDRRLNKRLGKQSWGWWFEALSRPLWRHCNEQSRSPNEKRICFHVVELTPKHKFLDSIAIILISSRCSHL